MGVVKGAAAKAVEPEWRTFEAAVALFLQAIDPSSKVVRDVMTPDLETGLPRQRDVWIETRFGGHLPLTILVSCKRTKAKISQREMDAFRGELMGSGATHGVLYSASGFTAPALAKAKVLGLACCMLLENKPAELPGMLRFDGYCFRERTRLTLHGDPRGAFPTMSDLFDLEVSDDGVLTTAVAALTRRYRAAAPPDIAGRLGAAGPPVWSAAIELAGGPLTEPIVLQLDAGWRVYRAREEAWLVNGSYCFNNADFKGSYSTPYVDRLGEHPGPGWVEIDAVDIAVSGNMARFVFHGGDWEPALRAGVGAQSPVELANPPLSGSLALAIDPVPQEE